MARLEDITVGVNIAGLMAHHCLPGETGDSDWIEDMSEFDRKETIRQVQFKRRHFPEILDGEWEKRPGNIYPHILPDGNLDKVFYSPISKDILQYCSSKENEIQIHSEALNLRSSQVCCFNVMYPMKTDLELAKKSLKPLLPGVIKVSEIEFEYTGPKDTTNWLHEPNGGKRGMNRTSIDVAIWWEDGNKKILTLCEWKYTEKSYGYCGGYTSKGNLHKDWCKQMPVDSPEIKKVCYLFYKKKRRYWDHFKESGIELNKLESVKGCPFRGPFYQLMRQHLLAVCCRQHLEEIDAEEVEVVSISFRDNSSLFRTPSYLKHLGNSIIDVWNNALTGTNPMRHVFVDDIIACMRESTPDQVELLNYLNERYGL